MSNPHPIPRPRKFTPEQEEEMCHRRIAGDAVSDIMKDFDISRYSFIATIFNRGGVPKKRRQPNKKIPRSLELELAERYRRGEEIPTLAKELNVRPSSIRRILEEWHEVETRSLSEVMRPEMNHSFFHSIDSESKAYWLGFLYADGCVSTRGTISLALQAQDVEHVRSFTKTIGLVREPTYNEKTKSYRVSFGSKEMTSDLVSHGVVPAKSLIATPPALAPHLERHFWRGVVDGDGSILTRGGRYAVSLSGTRATCEGFLTFVRRTIATRSKVRDVGRIASISIGGKLVAKIACDILYKDCTVALPRKMEKYVFLVRESEKWSKQAAHNTRKDLLGIFDNQSRRTQSAKLPFRQCSTIGCPILVGSKKRSKCHVCIRGRKNHVRPNGEPILSVLFDDQKASSGFCGYHPGGPSGTLYPWMYWVCAGGGAWIVGPQPKKCPGCSNEIMSDPAFDYFERLREKT